MKFRKKPVVIDAFQLTEGMFWENYYVDGIHGNWTGTHNPKTGYFDMKYRIDTLEGVMSGLIGDWIITGVNGEKYPCKPDIFEKTYEKV